MRRSSGGWTRSHGDSSGAPSVGTPQQREEMKSILVNSEHVHYVIDTDKSYR